VKTYEINVEMRNTTTIHTGKMKRRHLRRTLNDARKGRNFALVCDGITNVFAVKDFVRLRVKRVR